MFDFNDEVYKAIRGTYEPTQLFTTVICNYDNADKLEPRDAIVLFHEKFHHWQFIMTNYGQLKWASYRTVSSEVLDYWTSYLEQAHDKGKMPITYMLQEDNLLAISGVANIYLRKQMINMLNLKERNFKNNELLKIMHIDPDNIVPKICIDNKEVELNGIDIIEGFAKFQEAIFANIYFDIPIQDIINPDILNKEYYIALAYFIQELGNERLMEFPLVCDLALQTTHLSWPKNTIQWKDNHPAWRFLKLVKALEENPEINLKSRGEFEDVVSRNMNRLLQICGFETLDKIWEDTLMYLNNGEDLLLAAEMKRAILLKKECPWILAYPFLSEKDCERITDFHPIAYNFMNKTEYPDSIYNDELWGMETVFENHLQAFVRQVWGEVSKHSLYPNEIQCGFTYFDLKGCPYFKQGKCSGSIKCDEGLQVEAILDEKENIANGCSFGLFLLLSNINLENVDYEEVNTNITLEVISQRMKELKED